MAAFAAARSASISDDIDVQSTAAATTNLASSVDASIWPAVSEDTSLVPDNGHLKALCEAPLWHGHGIPEAVDAELELFLALLEGEAPVWGFWARWYDGFLVGHPMNWDMQREIALIPDADWEKGPAHIAGLIAEIEARFLVAATPLAERIEVNPDSGLLRVVPVPMANARLYETALGKVRDAVEDLRPGGELAQHHKALSKVIKRLDRTLVAYAGNPQRVHDDFLLSAKQIGGLVEVHEIADDEDVDALRSSLITGSDDIRAADADVRASVAARMQLRIDEMRVADTEEVALTLVALADVSEGELELSSREDAVLLRWPVDQVDVGERVDVIYRAAARASRAYPWLIELKKRSDKFVDGYDKGEKYKKAIAGVFKLIGWMLGLFG